MGSCNLDHSLANVQKKLQEQHTFLPKKLAAGMEEALSADLSQESLNDIFHLLKKYDLAPETERKVR